MSRLKDTRRIAILACLSVILVGTLACSVDTPTAPDQVPGPTPDPGPNAWNITVSVEPSELEAASAVPATVSIDVRSRDDGSRPPNGTTVSVSTSLGEFDESGSETKVRGLALEKGKGSILLFAGDVEAGGTVTARLEGSQGRDDFSVGGLAAAFITAVVPNSGSESGGTQVTIEGVGFRGPLTVSFASYLATVVSVDETSIRAITPPSSVPLTFETCGNGGKRYLPMPVTVSIDSAADNGDASLASAFFYTPDTEGCIGG